MRPGDSLGGGVGGVSSVPDVSSCASASCAGGASMPAGVPGLGADATAGATDVR